MGSKSPVHVSPKKTVRRYCFHCVGGVREDIKNCEDTECAFWPYRNGKRPPVKAFRKFCLQCANGSRSYIADCPSVNCPCYPYRFGTNPARARKSKKVHYEKGVLAQISIFEPQAIGNLKSSNRNAL